MVVEFQKSLVQGPFDINQAVEADYDRILDVQFAAFGVPGEPHHDPFHDMFFPGGNTPTGRANAVERTLKQVSDPSATFLVAREKSTGTIVAAAKWHIYEAKREEEKIDVDWLEKGEKKAHLEWVVNEIQRRKFARFPPGPHLIIAALYTHPDYSRRGAASQLVRWGLDRADERGLEVFVEASHVAEKFYEKLGFLTEDNCLRSAEVLVLCPAPKLFLFTMASNTNLNAFFVSCIDIAAQGVDCQSPVSPTTTLVVQDIADPQSRLSDPYPGAFTDFHGLPSNPRCVFKTGDAWPVRTGPEAQRILREARPVCDHPMQDRWLEIGQLIYKHLDSRDVKWSSVDPVRFAEAGEEEVSVLHLWIGVMPGTLAFEAAKEAAKDCKDILAREGFPDVEVAFRESVVTQSVGPKLLSFDPSVDPVPELRSLFTPTLGIQIAPFKTPYFEGTGAVYLREGGQSGRVFLLTANHVARPPNQPLSHKRSSRAREEIVVLGTNAYAHAINRMMSTIGHELLSIKTWNEGIERLGPFVEGEERKKTRARKNYEDLVEKANRNIEDVNEIHNEVTKHWTTPNQRVIGYVVHAPAIAVDDGPKHFTRDWALIDFYRDKIDWDTFQGNKVYVGGKISPADFILKMHPHPEGLSDFKYPPDGLLQVKGVVKDDEIRRPQQLDANGEKCLIVVKNGKTTGTTLGRLTGMESFIRTHPEYGIKKTSIEIAVYPCSNKDGAFSAPGDSGSIVVDSRGRIVGLLVAGAGTTEETDVTYLTPYWWIEEQMKIAYPNICLYEIVD